MDPARTETGRLEKTSSEFAPPVQLSGGLFLLSHAVPKMQVVTTVKEMQTWADAVRREGHTIALVPTMGYFHEGHLELVREGKRRCDALVVSVYVNPTQFGPAEDFSRYPRDFERDRQLAENLGVDVIFAPTDTQMYPSGYQTYVVVEEVTQTLCGRARPDHFRGVTTVCTKLFNAVKPHVAIFGKKDFQQYVTIVRMVKDLDLDLEIIPVATIREADGLAMSSRNVYLKGRQRQAALSLYRSLQLAKALYEGGERRSAPIIAAVKQLIVAEPETQIDYVQICNTSTLRDVEVLDREAVIALAVKVGTTRLIDNYVFGEPLGPS